MAGALDRPPWRPTGPCWERAVLAASLLVGLGGPGGVLVGLEFGAGGIRSGLVDSAGPCQRPHAALSPAALSALSASSLALSASTLALSDSSLALSAATAGLGGFSRRGCSLGHGTGGKTSQDDGKQRQLFDAHRVYLQVSGLTI